MPWSTISSLVFDAHHRVLREPVSKNVYYKVRSLCRFRNNQKNMFCHVIISRLQYICSHKIPAASNQVGNLGAVWKSKTFEVWDVTHLSTSASVQLVTTHVVGNDTASRKLLKELSFTILFWKSHESREQHHFVECALGTVVNKQLPSCTYGAFCCR